MITISGQLAIRTIHGRNSDCNVGHLATSIDELVIKNAELDQYREGKYEGDFVVTEIRPSTYNISGQMVIEIRAHLGGMTLSNIEPLRTDEVNRLSPQEVDPIDEESQAPIPSAAASADTRDGKASFDPLADTTPFGATVTGKPTNSVSLHDDTALFGTL